MTRERDVLKRDRGKLPQRSRALLGAGGLLVAGCSLQDLGYLGYPDGPDGGLSGSLNTSGASGSPGRGGSTSSNGGDGGTAQGGSGAGGSGGASGGGGSAGTGGSGSGGTTGGGGAGGSAGTAPVNYGGSAGYLGTDALADGGPSGNLIPDPGFEDGIDGWTGIAGTSMTWTTVGPAAGTHCLRASGRTELWKGPSFSLLGLAVPGETYNLSAYARLSHPNLSIKFTTKHVCQGGSDVFTDVVADLSATTSWGLYEGSFTVPTCTMTTYYVFAEQAPVNVEIFLDEVRIVPAP